MQVGTSVDFPSQRPGKELENSANPPVRGTVCNSFTCSAVGIGAHTSSQKAASVAGDGRHQGAAGKP